MENKAQWDDLAALIYTGGTTGVSKGAMLTHANLSTVVQQFRTWFPDLKDGEESLLGIYPIFHSAGYLVSQHLPIWSAWTCILIPRPEPGVIKDIIVAAGFNIYPKEIDEVLFDHPQILEACAIGVPDPYRGETVKAYVVVKPGESLTEDEVIQYCRGKLAAYKVPKGISFTEALPKSAVGKVLRRELRVRETVQSKS